MTGTKVPTLPRLIEALLYWGELTVSDIAYHLGIHRSNASRAIHDARARGYVLVRRERLHVFARLTARGRAYNPGGTTRCVRSTKI